MWEAYCCKCGSHIIQAEIREKVIVNGVEVDEMLFGFVDSNHENGGGLRDLCRICVGVNTNAPAIQTYTKYIFFSFFAFFKSNIFFCMFRLIFQIQYFKFQVAKYCAQIL